ncbi:hypothetical protein [Prauserella marina]|nr:hypothetical protein [Prauserella marina]
MFQGHYKIGVIIPLRLLVIALVVRKRHRKQAEAQDAVARPPYR